MLVVDIKSGEVKDEHFFDIIKYLKKGDVLILNDTKVIPARLFGSRPGKDEKIEVFLLKKLPDNEWECLVRPGKKMKIGTEIVFADILSGKVKDITETGERIIEFNYEGIFEEILDELGNMPLPPYIHEKLEDKDRYQTVYSKERGSSAAPTAGLHFTKELLKEIEDKGIEIAYITLHVGLGTFRPVKEDDIEKHKMHEEYYNINKQTANIIKKAKKEGRRIIAVGTTTVRTLESVYQKYGKIKEDNGTTDIFIYEGFKFNVIDCLLTNFHLPKSTLIMLVSAFAGKDKVLKSYQHAISEKYRFFSFGDVCFFKKEI